MLTAEQALIQYLRMEIRRITSDEMGVPDDPVTVLTIALSMLQKIPSDANRKEPNAHPH